MRHTLFHLFLLSATLSLASLSTLDSEIKNFPLIMWTHDSQSPTEELTQSLDKSSVIQTIKAQADASESQVVIVVVKEQLSTPRLVQRSRDLSHIKAKVLSHSKIYINVEESIKAEDITLELASIAYSINKEADIEGLKVTVSNEVN